MQKPHRFLIDRVASYAEEAAAFARRRRHRAKPFARVWRQGGSIIALDADSEQGRRMFGAASELLTHRD